MLEDFSANVLKQRAGAQSLRGKSEAARAQYVLPRCHVGVTFDWQLHTHGSHVKDN